MNKATKVFRYVVAYAAVTALGVTSGVVSARKYRSLQQRRAESSIVSASSAYLQQNLRGVAVGEIFPDVPLWSAAWSKEFLVRDILPDGGLVYYIALGCESCLEAVTNLQTTLEADNGWAAPIVVVASGARVAAMSFLEQLNFEGAILIDTTNSLLDDYGVVAFPSYFCLDRDQRVVSLGAEVRTVAQLSAILRDCRGGTGEKSNDTERR